MAVRIKFDNEHNVLSPTLILATKSCEKLGVIPAYGVTVRDAFNGSFEINFNLSKYDNGEVCGIWDIVTDFKLVWCREWDVWFEIYTEIDESNDTIKNVQGTSVGEAELSQINLYNVEINTEDDIARKDYKRTVLYNPDDPEASLLDRILEKAPHYSIGTVDQTIRNIQRTFSFDDTTILEAFNKISEEINCLFDIRSDTDENGKVRRQIDVYDIESNCANLSCGYRGDFEHTCPQCGGTDIIKGYGDDTTVFITTENLADEIVYQTNVDSVKNCFKLEAGDELMTAAIRSVNPNGSDYIWYISDAVRADMPEALKEKLDDYDDLYDYYQNENEVEVDEDMYSDYNDLITKYDDLGFDMSEYEIADTITGFPDLIAYYYNVIDFYYFLKDSLMPPVIVPVTDSETEAAKITGSALTPVAVRNIASCSLSTADSTVLSMAKILVNPNFQVKVVDGSSTLTDVDEDDNTRTWSGQFKVTSYVDDEDYTITDSISVTVNDNYARYTQQRLDVALNKDVTDETLDIVQLFKLDDDEFAEEMDKYSLARLKSFHDSCQSCIDVMTAQGISNPDEWESMQTQAIYDDLYLPYYSKLGILDEKMVEREVEIIIVYGKLAQDGTIEVSGMRNFFEDERKAIQDALNFQDYMGEELWVAFTLYRREDTYSNDNYISDGLNNGDLVKNAIEYMERARKEIVKSATLQHTISVSAKNLLAIKEFEPLVDYFNVGNWLRARIDGEIYKLRLLDYEIDFDSLESISITFSDIVHTADGISDIESILNRAENMATSYDSVARQAGKGLKSNDLLDRWIDDGLELTTTKIVSGADNQEFTMDDHGLLFREYLPYDDSYDDRQLKLFSKGVYFTNDNWLTSKAGLGEFSFWNPESQQIETSYGLIADTIVGNIILGESVGVYNKENSIKMDDGGLSITSTYDEDSTSFKDIINISRENQDGTTSRLLYFDDEGHLVINGSLEIETGSSLDERLTDLEVRASDENINNLITSATQDTTDRLETFLEMFDEYKDGVANDIQQSYLDNQAFFVDELEKYKAEVGQYLTFNPDGLTIGANVDGVESPFKTVIDNQRMAFQYNDSPIAYISGYQLYIPSAIIEQNLTIGKFYFMPREDGSVSITWQG